MVLGTAYSLVQSTLHATVKYVQYSIVDVKARRNVSLSQRKLIQKEFSFRKWLDA